MSSLPTCCIACRNENLDELVLADDGVLQSYVEFVGVQIYDLIDNNAVQMCRLCKTKIIDIDNFRENCRETLTWLETFGTEISIVKLEPESESESIPLAELKMKIEENRCSSVDQSRSPSPAPTSAGEEEVKVEAGKRKRGRPRKMPGDPVTPRSKKVKLNEPRKRGRPPKLQKDASEKLLELLADVDVEEFCDGNRCKECLHKFDDEEKILLHILQNHLNVLVCTFCYKTFDDGDEYTAHQELEQRKEIAYQSWSGSMRYGEFCQNVMRKIYPKPPTRKNSLILSAKLDSFCQLCNAHVRPYNKHLIQIHAVTTADGELVCRLCQLQFPTVAQLVKHFDEHRLFAEPHTCPSCNEQFTCMKPYKAHLIAHDNFNSFVCPECPNTYSARNSLNYHVIREHLKNFVCKHCFTIYHDFENFARHLKKEKRRTKSPKLKEMPKKATNIVKLEEPLAQETYDSIFCTHCNGEVFDYTNHLVSVHGTLLPDNRVECKECLTIIAQKSNFSTHFRNSHQRFQTPRQCPHCPETFWMYGEYNRHTATHKAAKQLICDHCGKCYTVKKLLRFHLINNHTAQRCCKFCSRIFDLDEYKVHMRAERMKRKCQDYVCDICGFATKHRGYLKDHVARLHTEDAVVCADCGKVCKTALNLRDHQLNVHREKKCLCMICGCKFRNQSFLKTHMQKTHSNVTVPCEECGKEVHPSLMKTHIFNKHSSVRPHECTVCGMNFKNKSGIQKHLHSHTGTRPFNCVTCGQGYYHRDLLQKHYVQNHGVNYTVEEMKQYSKRTPSALEKAHLEKTK